MGHGRQKPAASGVVLAAAGLNGIFHCVTVSAFCQDERCITKVGSGEVKPKRKEDQRMRKEWLMS